MVGRDRRAVQVEDELLSDMVGLYHGGVQVENQLPLIWIHRFLLFSFTRSEFSGFT
jgi:hypothetical protein